MSESLTEKAIDQLSMLEIHSDDEEIEVIYVENLSGAEIVDFARYGELQIIEELGRLDLLHRLREAVDPRGNTALHMASANGHLDVVRYILSVVGGDKDYVNRLNTEHNTALHWACLNGHADVVKALLESGADHTIRNFVEHTAFDDALQQNHESIMTIINDFSAANAPQASEIEES